jgi:hypothetical protein
MLLLPKQQVVNKYLSSLVVEVTACVSVIFNDTVSSKLCSISHR